MEKVVFNRMMRVVAGVADKCTPLGPTADAYTHTHTYKSPAKGGVAGPKCWNGTESEKEQLWKEKKRKQQKWRKLSASS